MMALAVGAHYLKERSSGLPSVFLLDHDGLSL
jgi:hypothetical protein